MEARDVSALKAASGAFTGGITWIVQLLGGVRATIFAAAALVLLAGFGIQTARLGYLERAAAKYSTAIDGYKAAQSENLATIDALQGRYTALVLSRRLDKDKATEAAARATRETERISRELEKSRAALDETYRRHPTARAWGNQGVDADVADKLPSPRR